MPFMEDSFNISDPNWPIMLRGLGSCGRLRISHVAGLIIGLFYPFI